MGPPVRPGPAHRAGPAAGGPAAGMRDALREHAHGLAGRPVRGTGVEPAAAAARGVRGRARDRAGQAADRQHAGWAVARGTGGAQAHPLPQHRRPAGAGVDLPAPGRRPGAGGAVHHGGPEAQERPDYRPLYQYLCSRGIAVMAPNIRGSTGYGKRYQRLIHRDWGGGDLRDLDHAVRWLRAQDWVDPDRIGVVGGSYGGFATLSCVTRLPEYWAAAVDIVGPSNLVTFAKAVPPTWRRLMARWVGDPETEADFLMERSPISYVDNVTAPLLVIQGAKDPRVVKAESDQMVERLRKLGREVEYVVFDDEGHGFTRRSNELRGWRLAADFLIRHLT